MTESTLETEYKIRKAYDDLRPGNTAMRQLSEGSGDRNVARL